MNAKYTLSVLTADKRCSSLSCPFASTVRQIYHADRLPKCCPTTVEHSRTFCTHPLLYLITEVFPLWALRVFLQCFTYEIKLCWSCLRAETSDILHQDGSSGAVERLIHSNHLCTMGHHRWLSFSPLIPLALGRWMLSFEMDRQKKRQAKKRK